VSVSVARWVGDRLASPSGDIPAWVALKRGVAWPRAAWGHHGKVYSVDASTWPVKQPAIALREFLRFPRSPLSHRAAAGFLSRAKVSGLHFESGFLNDVSRHVDRMARSLSTPHAIKVGEEQPACA
jgi:DNA (cytosine-5)-methyltransferase 1